MPAKADQFVVVKSEFCHSVQFVQRAGQDTCIAPIEVLRFSVGSLILIKIESFWSTLKRELVHRCEFATRAEDRAAIF